MASTTVIQPSSPLSIEQASVALFQTLRTAPAFSSPLTGPLSSANGVTEKKQSSPEYPLVEVMSLGNKMGTTVKVDLVHILSGKPTMGDTHLAGRGEGLTFATQEAVVNQTRHMVKPGAKMSSQRTTHDLRAAAVAELGAWQSRLVDQRRLVLLAGARGVDMNEAWIVPLQEDSDFASIMVNPVQAPTHNRHFYGGDATAVDNIDSADKITLASLDRLRALIDEGALPLKPVRLEGDSATWNTPHYVLCITPSQWYDLNQQTGETAWRTILQNAQNRGDSTRRNGKMHPLFTGDVGMWNGFIIRKLPRAIRFSSGSSVTVALKQKSFATETRVVGTNVERALLLGGQALAMVYGGTEGAPYKLHEEKVDHGNDREVSIAFVSGDVKLRFDAKDGTATDHGVAVLDTAATVLSA